MRRWPTHRAKGRFHDLLHACLHEGPQIVTHQGVETAVVLSVEEWRRLQAPERPTLKELLLSESPRSDLPLPTRKRWRRGPGSLA